MQLLLPFPYLLTKKTCIISQMNSGLLNAKTKGEVQKRTTLQHVRSLTRSLQKKVGLIVLVNGHVAPCVSYFCPIYTLCKEIFLYIFAVFQHKLGCHVNGFVLFFVFVIIVVINQNDMPTRIHHLVECVGTLNCLNLWLCCHSFVCQCLIHLLFPHHFRSLFSFFC